MDTFHAANRNCHLTLSPAPEEKLGFVKTRHIETKITAQNVKKSLMESFIFCARDL